MYFQDRPIVIIHPITIVQIPVTQAIPVQAVVLLPALQVAHPLEAVRMHRQEGFKDSFQFNSSIMGVLTSKVFLCVIAATIHQQKQTV